MCFTGRHPAQRNFTIVNLCLTIVKIHCARITAQDAEPHTPSPRFGSIRSFKYEFSRMGSKSCRKPRNRKKEKKNARIV